MAKKTTSNPKTETAARIQRTEAYANQVRALFAMTVNQILALNKSVPKLEPGVMFSFDAQSLKMQKEVERLLRQLHSVATMAIQNGIKLEWGQANAAADQLLKSVIGKDLMSNPTFNAWTARNGAAMNKFINRSERGLNLSDRVWKSVKQLREEMEVAITVAVGDGKSAQKMSQDVRQYLNDPDLMFRRFRYKKGEEIEYDENGNEIGKKIIWGKKWKKRIKKPDGTYGWIDYDRDSYKTGNGVYKSSAKNAMRVARTETNIAYRRADNERWNQMDFVLGQRINLSGDHPAKDICDKLAGDYPKEFLFDGWHPQCFCYVTPITLPPEETAHLTEMMLNGEDWRAELARLKKGREITQYPQNFKNWVEENKEKILNAHDSGTDPYFIRNNFKAINAILNPDSQKAQEQLQKEQQKRVEQAQHEAALETKQPELPTLETLDSSVPTFEYKNNKKMSYTEKVENAFNALDYYYGDSYPLWTRAKGIYKGMLDGSEKAAESLLKTLKKGNWIVKEQDPIFEAFNHLSTLKGIDISQVHPDWITQYNEIIKRINLTSITKDGFKSIYNEVEHAYNIIQLSSNKQVLTFGIGNVSTKMPYNILTEYQNKLPGLTLGGQIPSKEFWDSLPRYTPLVEISKKDGAYFSPSYKYVHISLMAKDVERLNNSPWYQKGLFHHEFGHAFDDMLNLRTNTEINALYNDFEKSIIKDFDRKLENALSALRTELHNNSPFKETSDKLLEKLGNENPTMKFTELSKLWKEHKEYKEWKSYCEDVDERLGGLSDCIMAALAGTRWVSPRGHGGKYFKSRSMQIAEFIAHMSENYWSGNDLFKRLAPEYYKRMREVFEMILKSK